MKEIWKLLELLNEYDSWWDYDDYYWPYQYWQDTDAYKYGKYYLVSRDYGFIKWLVENDKINYKKLLENSNFIEIRSIGWGIAYSLTMLLSIQDEPIDFLISILK